MERIRELGNVDAMQCGFMPDRETTNALLVVRKILEYNVEAKRESYICVLWIPRRHFMEFQEK